MCGHGRGGGAERIATVEVDTMTVLATFLVGNHLLAGPN